VQIIQNFGVNLIARQRLTFLQDIAKSDLFAIDECRRILLPTMLDRLVEHMEKDDTTRAADVDELTSCAEVIGDIVERLSADDQVPIIYKNFIIGTFSDWCTQRGRFATDHEQGISSDYVCYYSADQRTFLSGMRVYGFKCYMYLFLDWLFCCCHCAAQQVVIRLLCAVC